MTKKKKLAKNALKHPELFSPGELQYFRLWLEARKRRKQQEKKPEECPDVSANV